MHVFMIKEQDFVEIWINCQAVKLLYADLRLWIDSF